MAKKKMSASTLSGVQTREWHEHMRIRPGMYIGGIGDGSDSRDGVYYFIRCFLDNYVFEYKMGFGNRLAVDVADDWISIREFGRGIPFESVVDRAQYGMHYGMGCDTPDLHLLEYAFASATSTEFYVASFRDGVCFWARFSKGHLAEQGSEDTSEENGAFIKITPDKEVFHKFRFHEDVVESILRYYTYFNTGLTISFKGKVIVSKAGLLDLYESRYSDSLYEPIHLIGDDIEIVLTHYPGKETRLLSFVNGKETQYGGTHQDALVCALKRSLREIYNKKLPGHKLLRGISAVISIQMHSEPVFLGTLKDKLLSDYMWEGRDGNGPSVKDFIQDFVLNELNAYLEENKDIALIINQKLVEAYRRPKNDKASA